MARLPQPGSDGGIWGDVLNDFLSVSHVADGTLKSGSVTNDSIADGTLTSSKLVNNTITGAKLVNGTITDTQIASANIDGAAGTPSLRTLGTGANQAMPGNATVSPGAHAATHKGDGSDPIAVASGSVSGLMSNTDKSKLDGVAAGATANSSDAALLNRANHTGTQSADTITSGTTNKVFTATEQTKLAGIATGATANATDAQLRDRSTHTGTQTASTISDFSTAADARITAANKKTDSMATNKLLGRGTAGTGVIEEITLGTNLSLTGTTLNAVSGTGTTNLTTTAAPTTVTINSDTGTDAAIAAADGTNAGLFLPAEKTKLAGVASGATANATDAQLRDRSTHTGTQAGTTVTNTPAGNIAATTVQAAINELDAEKQPLNADLTAIAAIAPSNDDIIQRKAGAWTNRTPAQLKLDLTLVKGDVGLGNVDNTSDATKNAASAALTNKDLTSGTNTFPTSLTTATSTQTLTNKRLTPRVTTITSSATPTINTDDCDAVTITAQATAITSMTTNLTGVPTNFQKLIIRIKDDGTARAISWGASFEAKGVALPTTTVISKVLTVGFLYDTVTSKWGCVASVQET